MIVTLSTDTASAPVPRNSVGEITIGRLARSYDAAELERLQNKRHR
jgi:hypothetical protein